MKKSTEQLLMWGGLAAVAYFLYQKSSGALGSCSNATMTCPHTGATVANPNANMGGKNFGVTCPQWC